MSSGSWVENNQAKDERKLGGTRQKALEDFIEAIGGLYYSKGNIRGDVAVIGGGTILPEATLLCTEDSQFTIPRADITSITCVDKESFVHNLGGYLFIDEKSKGNIGYGQVANKFNLGLMWTDVEKFFHYIPKNSLDTILIFRQLENFTDLIDYSWHGSSVAEKINRCLRKYGRIFGSSSFQSENSDEFKNLLPKNWSLNNFELLSNPSPNYPFSFPFRENHIGFEVIKI